MYGCWRKRYYAARYGPVIHGCLPHVIPLPRTFCLALDVHSLTPRIASAGDTADLPTCTAGREYRSVTILLPVDEETRGRQCGHLCKHENERPGSRRFSVASLDLERIIVQLMRIHSR